MSSRRLPRLVFAGTPEFAATILEALLAEDRGAVAGVLTQPDRPSGRGRQLAPSAVKKMALGNGIPVMQPPHLRDPADLEPIFGLAPEVLVVAAYGLILPRTLLGFPRHGCLNVHASLLPRWRGAAPVERAIESGDAQTGVTIMQMDEGLDTGPMLLRRECPIMVADTGETLRARLAGLGAEAALDVLATLPESAQRPAIQDARLATYANKLRRDEARLDWSEPALVLARRIRAFNASNVCFTTLDGEVLRIWVAHVESEDGVLAPPGTVLRADAAGILVACGSGALGLTQLQLSGGRPLPVGALLNGRASMFPPGCRLA